MSAVETLAVTSPELESLLDLTGRLRSTLGKMELALGSLTEAIVWSDTNGNIQWCNSTFSSFARRPHLSLLGRPLSSILPLNQDGVPVTGADYPAIRVLAHPEAANVPVTGIYGLGRDGSSRRLEIYCTVLRSKTDDHCVVTVLRDVTEKCLAEEMLELETRRVELLRQVSEAANDTDSPEQALQVVLDSIGEHTGWPLGHAFVVSGNPPILQSSGLWWDRMPESSLPFREISAQVRYAAGEGLPGSVFEKRNPLWISDIGEFRASVRTEAALACELTSAFAFPILVGREVTAVIEFFSTGFEPPDDGLLRVASQVGTQLGRVVERRRSQQEVMRSKRELESRVTERTAELRSANAALVSEIGQREIAEKALHDAMDRYRSLVISVRDVIFAISPAGRIESVNPAFEQMTGFPASAWMHRRCLGLIHREDRPHAIEAFRALLRRETRPAFEVRVRRAGGGWTIAECSLSQRHDGTSIISLLGIARDVTERRRSEEQLILQDRAMAATSEGIIITNALIEGNPVVYANRGFEHLTGYSSSDVLGRSLSLLQGPDTGQAAVDEIRAAVHEKRQCTVELRNYRKDGTTFWNRLSITPIRDHRGQLTHYIGVQSDISGQKEAERLKNELVSTVSHELRTPLTSLRGFAELMLERDFPPEKRKKFLEIINKEATRLSNLINDFLDIQRMEAGRQDYRIENCSIGSLVLETIAVFHGSNPSHAFVSYIAPGMPDARADRDRVRQVLTNLTSNAIKFSPRGGEIKFTVSHRPADNVILCTVRDRGIGIPKSAIPKLFGKFYRVDNSETRKIGGTGLGLSVVKQIIEAHQGRVWVDSTAGEGSCFSFTLPAVTRNAPPAKR